MEVMQWVKEQKERIATLSAANASLQQVIFRLSPFSFHFSTLFNFLIYSCFFDCFEKLISAFRRRGAAIRFSEKLILV